MPLPSAARRGAIGVTAAIAIASPFIMKWEGVDYVAQHFKIDPPGVITVCNGITNYDLPGLKPGMKFTKDECGKLLADALPRYAAHVDRCVKAPISDNTRAALISFTYNVGGGALCKSSVVRKINEGDLRGGCDALLLYTRANGKFLQGLLNRRKDERRLCLA